MARSGGGEHGEGRDGLETCFLELLAIGLRDAVLLLDESTSQSQRVLRQGDGSELKEAGSVWEGDGGGTHGEPGDEEWAEDLVVPLFSLTLEELLGVGVVRGFGLLGLGHPLVRVEGVGWQKKSSTSRPAPSSLSSRYASLVTPM